MNIKRALPCHDAISMSNARVFLPLSMISIAKLKHMKASTFEIADLFRCMPIFRYVHHSPSIHSFHPLDTVQSWQDSLPPLVLDINVGMHWSYLWDARLSLFQSTQPWCFSAYELLCWMRFPVHYSVPTCRFQTSHSVPKCRRFRMSHGIGHVVPH